ncbi:hypothetical protein HRR95_000765 [Exophiala dermatitidis]|nr:hypothetical protein HRR95_000765 [Exophiala dermatitidis]
MEALIYDESPIAECLEADAVPFETVVPPSPTPSIQAFAPRGLPKLRKGLRTIRQTAATVTDVANEEFLERFRYIIVASQLLYDDPKPRRQSQDERTIELQPLSIRGAAITAGISFTIACYLDFVRRSAGSTLGKAVKDWHNFDATATEALRFVQEVEIVSRGYEISQPLPPVSRLEDKSGASRCRELRAAIGSALMGSISHCVEAHNAIQPFVRDSDLQRYHDIYEVSMQEYLDSVTLANATTADAQNSLRELRFLFRLHLIARKVFLCDLLALHTESTWYNIAQWRKTLQLLQDLDLAIGHGTQDLHNAVIREEFGEKDHSITPQESNQSMERQTDTTTPQKQYGKAQMRRLEAVANSIRALNAKVHLIREELEQSAQGTSSIGLSMEVCRHYESLGSEIRHVLMEWEKGRNTVFLGAGGDSDNRRSSLMSNGIQSPGSPSPSSLGGLTVVDGGPAEAFRLLSGEDQGTPDGAAMDEEVFEAVALPRKRTSWAHLTREEKLSKMQEDRRKRATLLEHAENTTNMLRELQMVIKHRPNAVRSEKRVTSI